MKLTIARKILGVFCIVGIVLAIQMFVTWRMLSSSRDLTQMARDKGFAGAQLADEIELNVVNTWQWLTDISVTRAAKGLDDGFEEAEKSANRVREDTKSLMVIHPDNRGQLEELLASFERFYDKGRGMAKQYIEGGTESGNRAMREFDSYAEDISMKVQALSAESEREAAESLQKALDMNSKSTMVGFLLGLAALALSFALGVILARRIARPMVRVSEVARHIAIGDIDQQVEYKSEDEIGTLADVFRAMINYLKETAAVANALSKGDLSVQITPASEKDLLGHAMVKVVTAELDIANAATKISAGDMNVQVNPRSDKDALGHAVARMKESINTMVADAQMLAKAAVDGKLSTRAEAARHQGDYHKIVSGINDTLDAIMRPIEEASTVLERIAARDLSCRMKGEYNGDHARIKASLNQAAQNLDEAMAQVAVGSEQVASAATEISSGSQALAQGASEQASSLQEIASSLQQMASMTKQNAANATEAKGLSDGALNTASKGVDSMHRLSDAVDKIKASSDATAKIVKTIDEIAFQTNLLALNAAVEAARAGDAGKGFAVVAEEVRNLAMRSAEAAKNTANMIEESVKNADNGVQLNMEVLRNLDEINSQVMKVGEVMGEIAAASEQQSQGVDQINTAVEQMNQVTQQNAASSEQSASASEQLTGQAEEMKSLVASFSLSNSQTSPTRRAHRPPVAASINPRMGKTTTIGNGGHRSGKEKGATLIPFEDEKESLVLQEF